MNWNPIGTLVSSLSGYNWRVFQQDFLAGLTVVVMVIPQGMAYALLAGLPPIYGLYACLIPLLVYALSGSSRHLSVGPVAIVSLLVLSGLTEFAEVNSEEFIGLAIATALIAGVIQILLGVLRLGFLIKFLSNPVVIGFTAAAALIIGSSQLRSLFGVVSSGSNKFLNIIADLSAQISSIHILTFVLGASCIVVLLLLKKINKKLPGALIIVIVSTLIVFVLDLDDEGIDIVGYVPKGLPSFVLPDLSWATILKLLPLSLTICLISFIESLAISKRIVAKSHAYKIEPNQELFALGISKVAGSFFQAFPTTGSFTRSAINYESGAKTQVSSLITVLLVSIVLLFLTPLFYYLPKATLSAIIVVAVINIVDFHEIKKIVKYHKVDFLSLFATFLLTLLLGVQQGVLTGIILSLAFIIYRSSQPHIAILGHLPDSSDYRNVRRFSQAIQWPEILIVRFDAQLYFANSSFFYDALWDEIQLRESLVKHFILDASSISDMDFTGMQLLVEFIEDLEKKDITFTITSCIGPVRDFIKKTSLSDHIEMHEPFLNVHDAVEYLRTKYNIDTLPTSSISAE